MGRGRFNDLDRVMTSKAPGEMPQLACGFCLSVERRKSVTTNVAIVIAVVCLWLHTLMDLCDVNQ